MVMHRRVDYVPSFGISPIIPIISPCLLYLSPSLSSLYTPGGGYTPPLFLRKMFDWIFLDGDGISYYFKTRPISGNFQDYYFSYLKSNMRFHMPTKVARHTHPSLSIPCSRFLVWTLIHRALDCGGPMDINPRHPTPPSNLIAESPKHRLCVSSHSGPFPQESQRSGSSGHRSCHPPKHSPRASAEGVLGAVTCHNRGVR